MFIGKQPDEKREFSNSMPGGLNKAQESRSSRLIMIHSKPMQNLSLDNVFFSSLSQPPNEVA